MCPSHRQGWTQLEWGKCHEWLLDTNTVRCSFNNNTWISSDQQKQTRGAEPYYRCVLKEEDNEDSVEAGTNLNIFFYWVQFRTSSESSSHAPRLAPHRPLSHSCQSRVFLYHSMLSTVMKCPCPLAYLSHLSPAVNWTHVSSRGSKHFTDYVESYSRSPTRKKKMYWCFWTSPALLQHLKEPIHSSVISCCGNVC